jgi:guanylate kinase
MVGQGKFIEHAVFSDNMYGTTFKAVEDVAQTGKKCILDIDAQVSASPEMLIPTNIHLIGSPTC